VKGQAKDFFRVLSPASNYSGRPLFTAGGCCADAAIQNWIVKEQHYAVRPRSLSDQLKSTRSLVFSMNLRQHGTSTRKDISCRMRPPGQEPCPASHLCAGLLARCGNVSPLLFRVCGVEKSYSPELFESSAIQVCFVRSFEESYFNDLATPSTDHVKTTLRHDSLFFHSSSEETLLLFSLQSSSFEYLLLPPRSALAAP